MKNRGSSLLASGFAVLALGAYVHAAPLTVWSDDFESDTVGSAPAGWTVNAPSGTSATVTDNYGTSNNSLTFQDTSDTGLLEFSFQTSGVQDGMFDLTFDFAPHPDTSANAANWPDSRLPRLYLMNSDGDAVLTAGFRSYERVNLYTEAGGYEGTPNDAWRGAGTVNHFTLSHDSTADTISLNIDVEGTTDYGLSETFAAPDGFFSDGIVSLQFATGRAGDPERTTGSYSELIYLDNFEVSTVPEPASLSLLGLGGGLMLLRRRRA